MSISNLQIFGTKKCPDTRKAERFFKERRVSYHLVDLAQKGPSAGELRKMANAVGGLEKLIDREGRRYVDRGLKYAAPTGPRIEQILLDDPLLLRTPIVRAGDRATVGWQDQLWLGWLASD
jgi:arsenate reductase